MEWRDRQVYQMASSILGSGQDELPIKKRSVVPETSTGGNGAWWFMWMSIKRLLNVAIQP
jgi:hypothetical protein